ncbi:MULTISPECIES: aminoglycoside phosphotransferase family protein [unclassified Ensifer]|uniref:aminoglycoside phosphotransferase family protein n=1 Tax=unclassified Ensifer TaxID=2633371 RepID=UPI000813A280|nr:MULTISPECIES: aminoglycoside phosphotransferase family protein [unclassified Ensifer]OCP01054.1 3'-kinase [Ensifer sp. LC11]OCP01628.1 3'-kinase [Ensifer sp. LC13]OCP02176.1 3'-kinase [Ensifer sp. LC14]OCP29993.1 3'-kinase [Ensifer sp. LC499]
MFSSYFEKWSLQSDGEVIATPSSHLFPVRYREQPAMLKVAQDPEEKFGRLPMVYWDGQGAAKIYESDTDAVLMERTDSQRNLFHMAMTGSDEEVTRIICRTVAELHAPRVASIPPDLVPLDKWFASLQAAAPIQGGLFARAYEAAQELLANPEPPVVLHGDVHHANILDFGDRGWLAIDPKRVLGDRGYDYANLFCNPELPLVTAPGRLQRHLPVVAEETSLAPRRILNWVLAYAGLSAAWFLEDDDDFGVESDLTMAQIAIAELNR